MATADGGPRGPSCLGARRYDCVSLSCTPSGWRDQMTAFIGRREFITVLGGGGVAGRGAQQPPV